jgi:uncharacterized membrane protein
MDLRPTLHALAVEHDLDAGQRARLEQLAGLDTEPAGLPRALPLGVAVLAAALVGLALIFWVAANWDTLGRFGRFALLQGVVVAAGAAALWPARARAPLALVAWLATGGLFAYYGQTYQTGADPWLLFALWVMLTLPLCLGLRTDVLWAPWALVAMTAVSLWLHAHTGHRWRVQPHDLPVHLVGWATAVGLVVALSTPLRRFTGSGPWSLRTAATLAVVMITATALGGLFGRPVAPHFLLGLVVLAAAAAAFVPRTNFDVFALSAAALGLNTLVVAGLARLLFGRGSGGDPIGRLLLLGLVAAGLLAASVNVILKLVRRRAAEQVAEEATGQGAERGTT